MKKRAAHCRDRADEADREAQKVRDPEMKRMYEDIAAAWRKLATFIEETKLDQPPDRPVHHIAYTQS
jgi:hypothetical protein